MATYQQVALPVGIIPDKYPRGVRGVGLRLPFEPFQPNHRSHHRLKNTRKLYCFAWAAYDFQILTTRSWSSNTVEHKTKNVENNNQTRRYLLDLGRILHPWQPQGHFSRNSEARETRETVTLVIIVRVGGKMHYFNLTSSANGRNIIFIPDRGQTLSAYIKYNIADNVELIHALGYPWAVSAIQSHPELLAKVSINLQCCCGSQFQIFWKG